MAITVTFSFDEHTVAMLDSLSLSKRDTKSSILRELVAKEYALSAMLPASVSAETVLEATDERK
jgi:hypothetical protein